VSKHESSSQEPTDEELERLIKAAWDLAHPLHSYFTSDLAWAAEQQLAEAQALLDSLQVGEGPGQEPMWKRPGGRFPPGER
jgi:hypothetical protein